MVIPAQPAQPETADESAPLLLLVGQRRPPVPRIHGGRGRPPLQTVAAGLTGTHLATPVRPGHHPGRHPGPGGSARSCRSRGRQATGGRRLHVRRITGALQLPPRTEARLPGASPESVLACRDKATTRALLADAGVPQPASIPVSTAEEARKAADSIGYPVVVKARGLGGSIGVVRVDGPASVEDAFHSSASAQWPGVPRYAADVLIEEYLTGPEISVDSVVASGFVTPMVLARKQVGMEPYFEETGHTVDAEDPLLKDADLTEQLSRIHEALGFEHGATHAEFKLTPNGPRLVEINARLGGDFIPCLGMLATGSDPSVASRVRRRRPCPGHEPEDTAYSGHPFPLPGSRLRAGGSRRPLRPAGTDGAPGRGHRGVRNQAGPPAPRVHVPLRPCDRRGGRRRPGRSGPGRSPSPHRVAFTPARRGGVRPTDPGGGWGERPVGLT